MAKNGTFTERVAHGIMAITALAALLIAGYCFAFGLRAWLRTPAPTALRISQPAHDAPPSVSERSEEASPIQI